MPKSDLSWIPFAEEPPEGQDLVVHVVERLNGTYSIQHRFMHGYWQDGKFVSFAGNAIKPSLQAVFKHWAFTTLPGETAKPFVSKQPDPEIPMPLAA